MSRSRPLLTRSAQACDAAPARVGELVSLAEGPVRSTAWSLAMHAAVIGALSIAGPWLALALDREGPGEDDGAAWLVAHLEPSRGAEPEFVEPDDEPLEALAPEVREDGDVDVADDEVGPFESLEFGDVAQMTREPLVPFEAFASDWPAPDDRRWNLDFGPHSEPVHEPELAVHEPTRLEPAAPARAIEAPVLLRAPPPAYPPRSVQRREEGVVVCRLEIGADGGVTTVELVRSSGYARLDEAALAALARWSFRPAREAGRALPSQFEHRVVFRLED